MPNSLTFLNQPQFSAKTLFNKEGGLGSAERFSSRVIHSRSNKSSSAASKSSSEAYLPSSPSGEKALPHKFFPLESLRASKFVAGDEFSGVNASQFFSCFALRNLFAPGHASLRSFARVLLKMHSHFAGHFAASSSSSVVRALRQTQQNRSSS